MNANRNPFCNAFSGYDGADDCHQSLLDDIQKTDENFLTTSLGLQRHETIKWLEAIFKDYMVQERVFAGTFLFIEDISKQEAMNCYRLFTRKLTREMFGKSLDRHPNRQCSFKHLPILEGGGNTGKQYHYHSILTNPTERSYSDEDFITLVRTCWLETPKTMKNPLISAHIEKVYDLKGWIYYQSKPSSKDIQAGKNYLDMLDIMNSRL